MFNGKFVKEICKRIIPDTTHLYISTKHVYADAVICKIYSCIRIYKMRILLLDIYIHNIFLLANRIHSRGFTVIICYLHIR